MQPHLATTILQKCSVLRSRFLPALLALGLPTAGLAAPEIPSPSFAAVDPSDAPESPPEGLARSDWSGIRAAHEAWKHRFRPEEDGGHSARNPGQQWDTAFDGRGFLVRPGHGGWEWGLELRGYGIGEKRVTVDGEAQGAVESAGGKGGATRLVYRRDARLSEWFRNDRRGLEQGWTLSGRPEGAEDETLTLELAVRGDLRPEVAGSGRTARFVDDADAAALTYGGLKAWDAEGRALEARFAPGGAEGERARLRIEVDDRGAEYPVTIDPLAQQAYLKASNTDGGDNFGWSVSVSGDTVVVGAPFEGSSATGVDGPDNDDAPDAGAAYVFVRSGEGVWIQEAYLKASNADDIDNFGWSVSVSGDTVVVGAPSEDSSATGVDGPDNDDAPTSGAAYVFVRSGETWSQEAYLKASNTDAFDEFGRSVSASGDTVVVGALGESSDATGVDGPDNNNASAAGAAYVFARSGEGVWSQEAYLKASNTGLGDNFGGSVSASGDTVVVGAHVESSDATGVDGPDNDNAILAGAAYVFARSGEGVWSQEAYLKASNTGADDQFGWSVSVSGVTVVAGAPGEASAATGVDGDEGNNDAGAAGAAYVFALPPPSAITSSDNAAPRIRVLKKKRLKRPRRRHRIVGRAWDDVEVAKVEVRERGRGWRKTKLRASGRWIHRTSRLKSGRSKFKVRAWDSSGNRSRVVRVRVRGPVSAPSPRGEGPARHRQHSGPGSRPGER